MEFAYQKVKTVKSPNYGTSGSAGIDFYIPESCQPRAIYPGEAALIPSGIVCKIPEGHCGVFLNKSGIARQGIIVGAQVIDSDYRGEVHIHLMNVSSKMVVIEPGQKIAQMVILPVPKASLIEGYVTVDTERRTGGFGSTGDK